jgi:type IV secretory pathway TrbF-like protein
VSGSPAVTNFAKGVSTSPSAGQYFPVNSGGNLVYCFNAADAGKSVVISYLNANSQLITSQQQIPNDGVYRITFSLGTSLPPNYDKGVVATTTGYASTGGAPAANQYRVTGNVYTFNAANAGGTVTINYSSITSSNNYQAIGYTGLANAAIANYQMGSTPQLSNHNFEVYGFYSGGVSGYLDADPSLVIYHMLTDTKDGVGFPASRVGSLTNFQNYCLANTLLISPFYEQQSQAAAMLTDIALATNSEFVWSSGQLTIVPYGDESASGNGATYTPPSSALYDLTDDDFIFQSGQDPVELTRRQASDAYNSIKIEIANRANQYNPDVAEAKDQAAIDAFGLRQQQATSAHLFCDKSIGTRSAQLQLQRQSINNTYTFTVDQRYIVLDPMDIVSLTDSQLGLNKQWVRIKQITENSDNTLTIMAEEYLQGTGGVAAYSFQTNSGFVANYSSAPNNVNTPIFFEPPAQLQESLEVWCAVSGGSNWGGCDVYAANNDANGVYSFVGRFYGSNRTGILSATLPTYPTTVNGQTIDQTNILSVDLSQSSGQLLSGTQDEALNYYTACYVDGEYISYQTAQLTGLNKYNLSYLVRGAYGSTISAHNAGKQFVRLDDSLLKIPFTPDKIGNTIYLKFLSFNLYGGAQQLLSDVTPASYTFVGTAYSSALPSVTNVRAVYVSQVSQISWDEISDFRPVQYEIRKGSSWNGAQILGRLAHPPFNSLGNDTYWIAAVTQPIAGITVYSTPMPIIITGATLVSNVIATYDEAATGWGGTVSGAAYVVGSTVRTEATGNILTIANILTTPDVLNYGGEGNGIYTIPTSHRINIGRVAPCKVMIGWSAFGQHPSFNILTLKNILSLTDVTDNSASLAVNVYPEIRLSQDGGTWGPWQKYVAGTYSAMAFDARVQLTTNDPLVQAIMTGLTFSVDVPDRVDHYVGVSIPSGGQTISYKPDGSSTATPFNGGPQGSAATPSIQVTINGASAGDDVVLSAVTLNSFNIRVLNGGAGVARNVNILVGGY